MLESINYSYLGFGLLAIIIIVILFFAINILKPDEMGLRVILGRPWRISVDSGLHLTIPFIEKIERYTKNQLVFKFIAKSVITKRAMVEDYVEPIESAEVNVHCTVTCYFDMDNLRETIASAPGTDATSLGPILVPYTQDIVRAIGGLIPWRVLNQDRELVARYVSARLLYSSNGSPRITKDTDKYKGKSITKIGLSEVIDPGYSASTRKAMITEESPFHQFGLAKVTFIVDNIDFTDPELAKAVSAPEKARLNAIEKRLNADAEQYEKEKLGKGDAVARREMIKVIKENPDLEMLRALEEMAKGTSNTILYQIPAAFEEKISSIMGGNNIGTLLKNMKPEDLNALISAIKSTT